MARSTVTLDEFGGLLISGDPFTAGPSRARDMRNVRVDSPGQIVTRGGFDTLDATTLATIVGFVRCGSRYMALSNASSGIVRIYNAGLAGHADRIAGTHFTTSVFTDGVGLAGGAILTRSNDVLLGVPFSTSPVDYANTPQAYFLDTTGVEGRYVAAYAQIGGTPLAHRVHFSNPNLAHATWGATDYVDLWAGDGQQIRGLATYRDQVFVFKDRRFAIFYGESTDPDGGALFNYRPVDVGIGCAYDHGAVAGPNGVYFLAANGIYRTVGDAPVLISDAIQALFDGATDGVYTGATSISTPRLFATPDDLYFVNDADVFRYHYATDQWTLDVYTPGVQFIAQTPTEKARSIYFLDGTGKACEAGDTFTDDDGSSISWSYTSGRYPLGDGGRVAIAPETSLYGSGTVTLTLDSDLYTGQEGTVTLGTAPAVAEGWPSSVDQEGTWLQFTLSGTGPASVSRIVHEVSSVKAASIR